MCAARHADDEFAPAKANLYAGALPHIRGWEAGRLEKRSSAPWSSQALCVSVWGTVDGHPAQDAALADLQRVAGVRADLRSAKIECEVRTQRELLNEVGGGTPTSRDVVIGGPEGVVVVESKFTELLGGCSQPTTAIPDRVGADGTRVFNCSGSFETGSDQKTRTAAPCRLMVRDGRRLPRRYWEVGASLFKPDVLTPPQIPCPFRGPSYQLMRNLCFASAFAQQFGRTTFGLLVAYVGKAPHAPQIVADIAAFRRMLRPEIDPSFGAVTYEEIADTLEAHDRDLARWIRERIDSVIAG